MYSSFCCGQSHQEIATPPHSALLPIINSPIIFVDMMLFELYLASIKFQSGLAYSFLITFKEQSEVGMKIKSNQQTQNYVNCTAPLFVTGNNNTFNIQASAMQITLTGNGNNFCIRDSRVDFNITGNGNTLMLDGTQLRLGLTGNGNEVKFDGQDNNQVKLMHKNGYGNLLPEGTFSEVCTQNVQKNCYPYNSSNVPNYCNGSNYKNEYIYNKNVGDRTRMNGPFGPGLNGNRNGDLMGGHNTYFGSLHSSERERREKRRHNLEPREDNAMKPIERDGLAEEDINRLPKSQYNGQAHECSICWEVIKAGDEVTYLFCFHHYHARCCVAWLRKSVSCPICQINVKQKLDKIQSDYL